MPADHPRTTLSPREAARLTGAGRSSIMRAIAASHLPARRDNRNQWQIARADLNRWHAARADHDRTMTAARSGPDRAGPADHPETALALAAAQATIAQLELRLTEQDALVAAAAAERDRWRAMAERLATREAPAPAPAAVLQPPRRRWWPWGRV